MDTDFNEIKVSEFLKNEGHKVYHVSNSDHHLYFDNPEQLMENLNDDLSGITGTQILPKEKVSESSNTDSRMDRSRSNEM